MFDMTRHVACHAGAALTLGLLASSALAQQSAPEPAAGAAGAPDPMPPNGEPVAAPAPLAPVLANVQAGHRRAAEAAGGRRLADVPPHL